MYMVCVCVRERECVNASHKKSDDSLHSTELFYKTASHTDRHEIQFVLECETGKVRAHLSQREVRSRKKKEL
jgi:hypothetical protein